MTADRWQKIEQLYHAALERPESQRAAYLQEACAGDDALRQEVESLLVQGSATGNFLEAPALELAAKALAETQSSFLIGQQLGSYKILSLLGAGGMGEVYQAHDNKLGRDVAIKVLPAGFVHDPDRLARFQREARMLAALNHPNIATIHGLDQSSGTHYLVMELVPGESLAEKLKTGVLAEKEVAALGGQIAEALEEAHEHKVVHRDLKPANVMVTPKGRVKVLDFGVARLLRPHDKTVHTLSVSETQGVAGTLPYMAPEQLLGDAADARTDLWALGAVLYEAAIGRKPFDEQLSSRLIDAILHRSPLAPREVNGRLSPELERIILKCLEKSPEDRYQSAKEIAVDLRRMGTASVAVAEQAQPHRGWLRWQVVAIAAAAALVTLAIAGAVVVYLRPGRPAGRDRWVQLTDFQDSVSQPTLSRDGRMLAFVRGPDTFLAPGQIYVKILPDGEPVQLTQDNLWKMSPVFSPGGSQIAYTTKGAANLWDTWLVSVPGGQPRPWLPNASGLVWPAKGKILFSEIKDNDIHMAIVAAEESRAREQEVYVPTGERGMAHRSYPSPDGKWALVVEMDRAAWLPCRLVPMDGSSPGRPVGPPGAGCTFAAWSPDGKWMYLSSSADGVFHTWRQLFPNGQPEQITSGPTEEEGIAMASDGRSFLTSVGLRQSAVWVHDSSGERQVSLEGHSYDPKFTPDGKRLCYRILKGALPSSDPSDLRMVELDSGRNEPLLPGFALAGLLRGAYDISSDGQQVVVATLDHEGKYRLWLAPLDRRSPPHQIPNVQGRQPKLGPSGEIFFLAVEGTTAFVYRVREDGTGLRKAIEQSVARLDSISPDGHWLVVKLPGTEEASLTAFSLRGGSPLPIYETQLDINLSWSPDRRLFFISVPTGSMLASGRTYAVPLSRGRALPEIPAGGFRSEAEIAKLPGARLIDAYDMAPGPAPDVYAFSRETTQRNLYRIPTP